MAFDIKPARDFHHYGVGVRRTDLLRAGGGAGIRALREQYIPKFLRDAGIDDVRTRGMRLVVDINEKGPSWVHLFAGTGVPNVNPQDWRTPKDHQSLRPDQSNVISHESTDVFGFEVRDPKSELHFLMLAMNGTKSFMDPLFTSDLWDQMFFGAEAVLQKLLSGTDLTPAAVRIISNAGFGFQLVPSVSFDVQAYFDNVPALNPSVYGFAIDDNGMVECPANGNGKPLKYDPNTPLREIIEMIEERKKIVGFGQDEKTARAALDRLIMFRLGQIRR